MCDPTSIVMATTTLITAATTAYTINSQKTAAEYQANIAVQQAEKAKNDAAYERQSGIEEARNQRLQAILNMGDAKTTIAAGNISTSSQTALNIVEDEKLNGELEALTTLKDSEKRAQDYLYQADQYYTQAGLTSFKSKSSFNSSMLNIMNNSISSNTDNIAALFK